MRFLTKKTSIAILRGNLHQTFQRWIMGFLLAGCVSASASAGELINVSTRGFVGTGENVLIGGFIIEGSAQTVLVRSPGPSLTAAGISGVLANPSVELFSGQTSIAFNDDWQTAPNSPSIPAQLRPQDSRESAILITLNPGAYTAIVRGVGDTTGVALIEVFSIVASGEFSGRWSVLAPKVSDTCDLPLGSLSDTLVVEHNDSQLLASMSNETFLFEGMVNTTSGEFTLTQTNPSQGTVGACTFEVKASNEGNFRTGAITSTLSRREVSGSCPSNVNCDTVFVGTLMRQSSLEEPEMFLQESEGFLIKDAINFLLE